MKMTIKYFAFCIIFSFILSTCSPFTGGPYNQPEMAAGTVAAPNELKGSIAMTNLIREQPVASTLELLPDLVLANNQFGFNLVRTQFKSKKPKNFVFSPYSIALGLAQVYGGAATETGMQMRGVLNTRMPAAEYHQTWNRLDQQIIKQSNRTDNQETDFELKIENSIWVQDGYPYQQKFLDLLATQYGSSLHPSNFMQDPQTTRLEINDWVAKQTQGKFEELVPAGAIDSQTLMALINTIYLKAAWEFPFAPEVTTDQPFYREGYASETVPMMYQSIFLNYQSNSEYILAELPYDAGQLSFLMLMPIADSLQNFIQEMDATKFNEILVQSNQGDVDLWMPKLKIKSAVQLDESLKKLGMVAAFDPQQADFSGIDAGNHLYIGQVLHQAFIDVDESGTEAAAATAILMQRKGMKPIDSPQLKFDHPFLFIVRDRLSGTILFLGVFVGD